MNPQQEYYLRNNVRAPYIFHGSGKIILNNLHRIKSCDRYRLVEIKAINKEGNDGINIGRFEIAMMTPQKCGPIFGKADEWTVYWTDYPDFVQKKVEEWKSGDWRAICEPTDMKMSCWELLAYSQDSRFADLPFSLLDLNYKLLDCNMPFDARSKLLDSMLNHMTLQAEMSDQYVYKTIISAWSTLSEVVNSPKYAHWLARLVNR